MKLPKPAERIVREVPQLHIPICAGNASFFLLLSLFPLAILLLTILQYIPVTKNDLLALIEMIVPQTLWPFFEYLTNDLYADRSFAILSFSIIATLWSASKGLHSVLYGLNKVAGAEETRPWLHRRLLCMMYTLVTLAALILTLLLNVFGKRILAFLEVHRMLLYVPLSQIMRHTHLYSLALLTLYFSALYLFLPNRRERFIRVLPGALAAAGAWLLFSAGFSLYVNQSGRYSSLYGSLSTILLTMLWLYICLSILFYGAYLNQLLASVWTLLPRRKKEKAPAQPETEPDAPQGGPS